MNKVKLFFIFLWSFIFIYPSVFAQDWVKMMQDPSVKFTDVKTEFNKYYTAKKAEIDRQKLIGKLKFWDRNSKTENQEEFDVPGYSIYKRWEWFQEPRQGKNGERVDPARTWHEMEKYNKMYPPQFQTGNWSYIGPTNGNNLAGVGRCNFIRVDPMVPTTLYTGSPSGGLWKSTNSGATWTTNTDQLNHVIGCTDIAIDPANNQIMYLATGDGDAGDNNSIGVLKSTDGGTTWNTTGLTFSVGNYRQISKILIHPANSNILLVASSAGIYRSTDAGVTFTNMQAGGFKDLEFQPGNPDVVYTCGTQFYKSVDNGITWTNTGIGLPAPADVSRMAIAVSPADPSYIYMIVGLPAPNYGTEGFYKSSNEGVTWSVPSVPNIGTQQWYDLCIAVSPNNKDEVILGGQTQFLRTTNGGASWSNNGSGTHVDYHDIIFTGPTTYYTACDGGLYRTTNSGGSWTHLDEGMQISQLYGFGQSTTNPDLYISGWQDNGTNLYDGTWGQTMGGDGMLAFISKTNDNYMWGSQYNGSMNRSTNGGNSWSACGTPPGTAAWVTPWREDPVTPNTIYCGFNNVYKSTNGGISWTALGNLNIGTTTITAIAISPANTQVIWASAGGSLYKTNNGGNTWSTISGLAPGTISYIACHDLDANKAYITYSGYSNTLKVFQTDDQGATWINLSGSLPNVPINCITYMSGSNDGLYIGTDVGVFYKDASFTVWQSFSSGLPKVIVTQIEIFSASSEIRCSTYGRGMWKSGYYVPGNYAPVCNFTADSLIGCPGTAVHFTDYSSGVPTQWNWSFPGGSPASSTQQNPLVYYTLPGSYPVTLTVTNSIGSHTQTLNSFINISSSPNAPGTVGDSVCSPGGIVNLLAVPASPGLVRWWDAPFGGSVVATGNTYSPNISATTTYYVDESFPATSNSYVGAPDNTMGVGTFFTANDIRGNYFDVLSPVILNSVQVYANTAGNRTIEIIDANGNTFIDTTVFIPASAVFPATVTLNFTLYPGTGYFIKCRGFVDLFRNSDGAGFPYTSSAINITGTNAGSGGYYYFFYNWAYTEIFCNTPRIAVTGTVRSCASSLNELFAEGDFSAYPNPSNGSFDIAFNVQNKGNYEIKVYNTLGEAILTEEINNFSGNYVRHYDLATIRKGMYSIVVSSGQLHSTRRLIVSH